MFYSSHLSESWGWVFFSALLCSRVADFLLTSDIEKIIFKRLQKFLEIEMLKGWTWCENVQRPTKSCIRLAWVSSANWSKSPTTYVKKKQKQNVFIKKNKLKLSYSILKMFVTRFAKKMLNTFFIEDISKIDIDKIKLFLVNETVR